MQFSFSFLRKVKKRESKIYKYSVRKTDIRLCGFINKNICFSALTPVTIYQDRISKYTFFGRKFLKYRNKICAQQKLFFLNEIIFYKAKGNPLLNTHTLCLKFKLVFQFN